jgi:hypothetical protein
MMKRTNEKEFTPVGEASIFASLNPQTIRKLFDTEKISGYKTPSEQRKINGNSIQKMCNTVDGKKQENKRENFMYTREKRIVKCANLFENIRKNINNKSYSSELLFQQIIKTNRCDVFCDLQAQRYISLKTFDSEIVKKLTDEGYLSDKQIDIVDKRRNDISEFLNSSFDVIDINLRKRHPYEYYTELYDWKPITVKLLLIGTVFRLTKYIFKRKF